MNHMMLLNRKRSLCECDLMFAKQFREAFKSWKVNYHIFLYGWSPSADCVPSSSTGQEKVLSTTQVTIASPTCSTIIARLNSGIRNRHNFFLSPIFLYQKVVADLVSHADSGDIKVFSQFPGNSILKISLRF